MSNVKDFIELCVDGVNSYDISKIINFNNRSKKQYVKNLMKIPLYFLVILLLILVFFCISEKNNISKVLLIMIPLAFPFSVILPIILLISFVHYMKRYYKFTEKLNKAISIKKSRNSYRLSDKRVEFVTDDKLMTVVCFMEVGSNPEMKYEVVLEQLAAEYDQLIENNTYRFYSIDDKKLFIIDDIYN